MSGFQASPAGKPEQVASRERQLTGSRGPRLCACVARRWRSLVPLLLLLCGLALIAATRNDEGVILGVLIANGAFAVWVAALMAKLLRGDESRQEDTEQSRSARPRTAAVEPPARVKRSRGADRLRLGDYVSSKRELYRIEHVRGERVLIEECRTGALLDIGVDQCSRFELVKRSGERHDEEGVEARVGRET